MTRKNIFLAMKGFAGAVVSAYSMDTEELFAKAAVPPAQRPAGLSSSLYNQGVIHYARGELD